MTYDEYSSFRDVKKLAASQERLKMLKEGEADFCSL